MPIIYEAKNGVLYKHPTESENKKTILIQGAIDHSIGTKLPHTIDQIEGSIGIKSDLKSINDQIQLIRNDINKNTVELETIKTANQRIRHLEVKLFYNAWFFKNSSYNYLEFDSFEDESKLFYGKLDESRLVPENGKIKDYSIYRSIKFIPKLTKSISRYMMHVEYSISNNGGLIAEISFDGGNKFHTVLSTITDTKLAYYYQYPDFCDCDNNVSELDSNSCIVRFRLLSDENGKGVSVSSYGIMLA